MVGPRDGAILVILGFAWLQVAVGVKDHAAALNETDHPTNDDPIANEVSFSNEILDHPHRMPGKPSKFDLNASQTIEIDDDRSRYQIESIEAVNATVSPTESTRKDLIQLMDRLSAIDAYNVTESVQIVRNHGSVARRDEKGNDGTDASLLDKVRRYAREHVVKIRLSQELIPARKARTFFNGEFTERRVTLS